MTYEYKQYLAHYGVKGQKKGIRRYQNEDGSYTQEGAEHYWGGGHGRQKAALGGAKKTEFKEKPTIFNGYGFREQAKKANLKPTAKQLRRYRLKQALRGALAIGAGAGAAGIYLHERNKLRRMRGR